MSIPRPRCTLVLAHPSEEHQVIPWPVENGICCGSRPLWHTDRYWQRRPPASLIVRDGDEFEKFGVMAANCRYPARCSAWGRREMTCSTGIDKPRQLAQRIRRRRVIDHDVAVSERSCGRGRVPPCRPSASHHGRQLGERRITFTRPTAILAQQPRSRRAPGRRARERCSTICSVPPYPVVGIDIQGGATIPIRLRVDSVPSKAVGTGARRLGAVAPRSRVRVVMSCSFLVGFGLRRISGRPTNCSERGCETRCRFTCSVSQAH